MESLSTPLPRVHICSHWTRDLLIHTEGPLTNTVKTDLPLTFLESPFIRRGFLTLRLIIFYSSLFPFFNIPFLFTSSLIRQTQDPTSKSLSTRQFLIGTL